jgi:L-asparaginase
MGVVDDGRVELRRAPLPRLAWRDEGAETGLRVRQLEARVELLQVYTGMTDRLVRVLTDDGARGLALVAFGRGNVPPPIMPALEEAIGNGVLVTVSSRCVAGRVKPRYGYVGGGQHLAKIGALLAGDLSGAKARLLQMVALGMTGHPTGAAALIRSTIGS